MRIRKAHPITGQAIDMRCRDFGAPITTNIAIAHIIRHDKDNISGYLVLQS
jgi:hypothetical protein